MSLKRKLITEFENSLKEQDYIYFKDSFLGATALFVKKINPNLFLTLGLETSRYEKDIFTASLYLSKTTCWSCIWGDIPQESFNRIGFLLNENDKNRFLGVDYEPGVKDIWWNIYSPNTHSKFIDAIQEAEIKFITPELIKDIYESSDVSILYELATNVIDLIKNRDHRLSDFDFRFTLEKQIDNIPDVWFKSAEIVLSQSEEATNKNRIKLLASDAYRINAVFEKS
ncbi:hypothetical protein QE422_001718 [Chryseobacterium sp. SORGH_AS 447]|uniref:hypothetical protein n=1 Tax=Chryseobacterium sp. SORGH_AS_0447 TaxID=3041769 RepID=UPI00277F751A|nr:hypothetical protein [Chryseobacterium sp. SORGH_AS_0447]MDQ1161350.1 hypothetical protein [Chryseobacterium sp. SORGH_AS_0447]